MDALDLKDRKIIYELDKDSRQSLNELAKKVRLSKDVVGYRVKRLENEGYILGYQTLIDFTKIGYNAIRFYINLINTSPKKEEEIIDYLVKDKKVFLVSETEGYTNISLGILVKDTAEIKKFQKEFEVKFKSYIKEMRLGIYLDVFHFNRDYLIDKKSQDSKAIIINSKAKIKVDEKDIEILKILSKNARTPLIEISKKLKVNANTIAFRIKNLEKKGVILGYKIIFGFSKINYIYIKVDLSLNEISREKEILQFCKQQNNIIYALWATGGADIELFFEIENVDKFLNLIKEMRENFKEIIEWKYTIFSKYHKFNYFIE